MPDADATQAATRTPPRTPEEAQRAIARFREDFGAVRAEIAKAIVGHEAIVDGVLTCLFANGHCLLEGVPGLGKTLLIRSLAQALHLKFSRVQFTPDLMPADVTGTTVVTEGAGGSGGGGGGRQFTFQRGPIFAQIVLADEINRATPKTQSALLEAMQERAVTVAGVTHVLDKPFFVMATQNPIEQEGTYPLPEAQLDRFMFKLLVGYSGREALAEILRRTTTGAESAIAPALDGEGILAHQALVRRVAAAPHIQDYAVRVTLATHAPNAALGIGSGVSGGAPGGAPGGAGRTESFATPMVGRFVRVGASPRAAQSMMLGAKVRALLDGRPSVSIDDIRAVAAPALRHRILLNFEGEAEGVTTDAIVENILATLPVQADKA